MPTSMGAQWKNQNKSANAAVKGAVVHKLVKEITVAAKLGGPSADGNPRLRAALEAARKQSVSKDTVERAIKKGAGLLDEQVNYETVVFEGFAPHQVPVIVECLTDNKNRTSSEVRVLFRKGHLGTPGSVAWQFDHMGVVEASKAGKVDIEEAAIEAGAQTVESMHSDDAHTGAKFITEISDLNSVNEFLSKNGWAVSACELQYVAKNNVELNDTQKKEVIDFLTEIDDYDDVHRVYAALK